MTLPPSRYPEVREKWVRWLDLIKVHLLDLHHHRAIWQGMSDAIVEKAPETPDTFLEHYTKMYVDAAVMGVRRMADQTSDQTVISLGRLLADIRNQPAVLSVGGYIDLYLRDKDDASTFERASRTRRATEEYEEHWGDGAGELDVARVDADLDAMADQSKVVTSFGDRMIAHLDRRGLDQLPTFRDLDAAVDVLGRTYKRYSLLLTAGSTFSLVPTIQDDWRATFRRPLFEPLPRRQDQP